MNTKSSSTFRELSEIWYEQHSIGVTYSYQRGLQSMLTHLNHYFGDIPIQDVKPSDINRMITELATENPNTKKPTSRKLLKELIHLAYRIFDMAIDNDLIYKNPAKNKCKDIPKSSPKEVVNAISKEEQILILQTPHRFQTAALIMMLAGLRKSEVMALEWNAIDFRNKTISVRQHAVKVQTNEYEIKYGTKNGKTRRVTIPNDLCAYLYSEKERAKTALVFPKTDGKLHTPSSWESAWRSYINTLNWEMYIKRFGKGEIPNRYDPKGYPKTIKIHPHQLRHTYATLLYKSKVDPLTASKLLGHSTVQLTLDIYTHLDEQYKTLDISNFNDYLKNDLLK